MKKGELIALSCAKAMMIRKNIIFTAYVPI